MKKSIVAAVVLGLFAFASSASADQLLFTKGMSKSGSSVAVDYMSDGRAVGLQFEILVPGKAQVDLSGFAKSLPKGFTAEHNVVDGKLIIMIVNDQSVPLPAGLISLGTIKAIGGTGEFVLERLYSADAQAQLIDVETVQ
ncbi:MAG: hypothetical protein H4O13_11430 [Xanthomonadales bacterium]|nr:hypothetical protein [Xanthomonadales bacterium]